jgi:hypothetical protein
LVKENLVSRVFRFVFISSCNFVFHRLRESKSFSEPPKIWYLLGRIRRRLERVSSCEWLYSPFDSLLTGPKSANRDLS